MPIYEICYRDGEDFNRSAWAGSKREAASIRAELRRDIKTGKVVELFGTYERNVPRGKRGLLRWLNNYCTGY